jgi:hypothetical protein
LTPPNDQNHPVAAKRFLLQLTPDRQLGRIFCLLAFSRDDEHRFCELRDATHPINSCDLKPGLGEKLGKS